MKWDQTPIWNKARYRAFARLRDRHRAEYEDLMYEELRRVGLPRRLRTADDELKEMYGV